MKKKIFTISSLFCLLLAALLLTACTAPPGSTDAQPGNATPREVKVTVIVDNIGDLSYNDGIIRELELAQERYLGIPEIDLAINVFSMETGTGNEKAEVDRALQEDSELIIIANQIAIPVIEPAIAYHPEKRFITIDMEATGENIYTAFFRPNESSFLCGYLAAKMSETGIIGIVIGMDIPALFDFAVGYIQGAQAADPECKVIVSTVGNFFDSEMGYALAESQFEAGADIIFSAAGGAGLGCIEAANDHGRYAIGVDVDQTEFVDEHLRDVIITSGLKNFDTLTSVILEQYISGELEFGQSGRFGLLDGAVGIAKNSNYLSMVPQDIRDEVDAQEELLRNGTISISSAFEMTQTEIDELIRSVSP